MAPLLLLHPFPLDARFWDPVRPGLEARGPLIAPCFPGFGGAPAAERPSIDAVADDLAALIAREAGGQAAVCGLSLGGYLALSLALRHPGAVTALVLANTRAEADDDAGRAARDAAVATIAREGLGAFLDGFLPRLTGPGAAPEVVARVREIAAEQPPEAVAAALRALRDRPDRVAALASVRAPTLVVAGEEDRATPVAFARTLARGIPGARLVVMPGVGHLSAIEAPRAFAEEVAGFLAGVA